MLFRSRLLYDHAKRMLALRDDTIRAVNELQHVQRGHLRVGAPDGLADLLLPRLLAEFSRQQPETRAELFHQSPSRLLAGLRMRHLDFAILAVRPEDAAFDAAPLAVQTDGSFWLVWLAHSAYSTVARELQAFVCKADDGSWETAG